MVCISTPQVAFHFHSDTDHILATEIHEIGSVNYIHAAGYDKLQA